MSGGKDSTALALYMRDRQEDMEYVFCDTDKELIETYEYLNRVEVPWARRLSAQRQGRLTTGWRSTEDIAFSKHALGDPIAQTEAV
jgi:3'-phosphoadenosine 5'-phosphosulfate sulfotransferase (PAPS reductase)/FAD synthetase